MDQELQDRVESSRASWYERAAAAGVTPPAATDSWAALNPGAGWAAAEDRARTDHDHEAWIAKNGAAGSVQREETKEQWALDNAAINAETRGIVEQRDTAFRAQWEEADAQVRAEQTSRDWADRGADASTEADVA